MSVCLFVSSEIFNRIAVYDLGGGTFDISILEIQKGVFEVSVVLRTFLDLTGKACKYCWTKMTRHRCFVII